MFIRTPSLMSGSQPIGCLASGFHRTKMSKGGSPSRIASSRFCSSIAAARRSSAPPSLALHAVLLRVIHSPR